MRGFLLCFVDVFDHIHPLRRCDSGLSGSSLCFMFLAVLFTVQLLRCVCLTALTLGFGDKKPDDYSFRLQTTHSVCIATIRCFPSRRLLPSTSSLVGLESCADAFTSAQFTRLTDSIHHHLMCATPNLPSFAPVFRFRV